MALSHARPSRHFFLHKGKFSRGLGHFRAVEFKEPAGLPYQWERGHEKLFKHLHDKAFEEYAQMPWGG
jgi:hypothetical protein